MNRRKLGETYETVAARYLQEQGYEILHRNYRCRMGELDLIAKENGTLVFVEVKYRTNEGRGSSLEAVDAAKRYQLGKMAVYYLMKECGSLDVDCRFDVIGIDGSSLRHIRNAFTFPGSGW